MVIKSFQMPIGNGHWESNFFNGYFSPIVVENDNYNNNNNNNNNDNNYNNNNNNNIDNND